MKPPLLCLVQCLFLISSVLSAEISSPDPKPGNDLYTVFPKEGADLPQTIDFIKGTVGAEDLLPWTDVQEHLKHWTVEASPDEVSKLQAHAGIDKVSKLELPQAPADAATHVSRQAVQDKDYLIFPVKGEDHQQNNATDKALKDMLGKRVQDPFVSPINGQLVFWTATLNAEEVVKVKGTSGVGAVETDEPLELDFAIPETRSSFPHVHLDKRAIAYKKQPDAVTELVAISQPSTIPEIKNLKDYVYESHSGEGTFVYHIEFGVAFAAQKDEFAHVADEHILTKLAKNSNKKPEDDEASDPFLSHGTCTAGKAVGQKYGASKKATLVVVKLGKLTFGEMVQAIEFVATDVASKPARRKKSVVTMSFGVALDEKLHVDAINRLKAAIEGLFKVDVPVVVTSGNHARKPGRAEVDRYPALLAGVDMPLIVVGAIDPDGKKSALSQGGPKVTIHAVGKQNTCLPKDGKDPIVRDGTSVAGPLVAGELANLLSYETVPFDTSDGNVAKNALAYLKSEKASWARVPGISALWNGVTEKDNPKAGDQSGLPPPPPPPPPKDKLTCNGLKDDKYVALDTLKDLIENKFCPEAVKQGGLDKGSGSIMRPYNDNTPEAVHIAIDFRPGLGYKPTMEDCVKSLMSAVDNCDGNDPANNPQNYKGGGRLQRGEVTFRVGPTAKRAPAKLGKTAGCDSSYKGVFNEYWVWGHGFVSSDWGNALKNHVSGCALLPQTWSFEYGIGDDGREWTARFRTGVFQKKCVGNAIKSVSGFGDFGCNGSG